ncbi:MAG: hypothetical protein RDV41_09670 [Planctomycetota bacterium]|nr:hypothetical protein [Planctomycetota bacterium]
MKTNVVFAIVACLVSGMAGMFLGGLGVAQTRAGEPTAETIEGDAETVVKDLSDRTGVRIGFKANTLAGRRLRVEYTKDSVGRTLHSLAMALEADSFALLQRGDGMEIEKFRVATTEKDVLVVGVAEGQVEVAGGSAVVLRGGEGMRVYGDGILSELFNLAPDGIAPWRKDPARHTAPTGLVATLTTPVQIRLVGATSDGNLPIIECGIEETRKILLLGAKEVRAQVLEVTPRNIVVDRESGEMEIALRVRFDVK